MGKKQDTVESNILMRDTLEKTRTVRVDVQHDGEPVEKEDRMTQAGLEKGPEQFKINMLAALQQGNMRVTEDKRRTIRVDMPSSEPPPALGPQLVTMHLDHTTFPQVCELS